MVRASKSLIGNVKPVNHPREYPIFSPRESEWPPAWFNLEQIPTYDLNNIRLAKHGDRVIAAYEVEKCTSIVFTIKWLIVDPEYRNQGLGGWLLAHAIGIIESKGGREVWLHSEPSEFSQRVGFEAAGPKKMKLTLTPE